MFIECPTLSNQITYGDIIQAVALLIAAGALFVGWLQIKASNRQKRAEFIITIYTQFTSDKDLIEIYYKLEYSDFKYDPQKFHKSGEEKQLDKLLDFFDNIARLKTSGNFDLSDLDYVAYNYLVIYQDSSVNSYLSVLDRWYETRGMKLRPFDAFRTVGKELEDKFYNK